MKPCWSAFALLCCLAIPAAAVAKGASGGHGSSGHGGGGHAGGHTSGGHASGGGQTHGTATTGHATPRGTSTTASPSGSETAQARPRGPRPPIGTAVPRSGPSAPLVPQRAYVPYGLWPYYGSGFGLGLGLGLYDAYDDPYWYGAAAGFPSAYPYDPTWVAPPPSPYGASPYPFDRRGPTGGLRLKIEPKDAQVYVDGYYAGIVDDFNGHFQHLDLVPGPHHAEVRAPGYEPLQLDVNIQPHHTTQYRGTLTKEGR